MAVISFRECYAEFMGVFALVFFGGWGVILAMHEKQDAIAVGMIYAAVITAATWISSKNSSCHFNPSITLGSLLLGATTPIKAVSYVVSQICGSYVGAIFLGYTTPNELLKVLDPEQETLHGMPRIGARIGWISTSGFEIFGTMIATIAVFSLTEQKTLRTYAPAIGCIYGVLYMCFGEFNSTSFNPCRYLGPALDTMKFTDLPVYIFPSLVGGVLGAFLFDFLFKGVKADNLVAQNAKIE